MKKLIFKLEDKLRTLAWYSNYYISKTKKKQIPEIKKILIIDLKFVGDLIIDTPLIRALKNQYKNSEIHFLLTEGMQEIYYKNPNIKTIYTNKDQINEKFDLAVLLHPGNKSTSKFIKKIAKYRIGIRRSGFTEPKGFYLNKKTKPTSRLKHKIEDNLDVLKTINIKTEDKQLEIYINKKAKDKISSFITKNKLKKPIILINTVSNTHPTWPKERFASLSDILIQKYKANIIFIGVEKDKQFIDDIITLTTIKPLSLTGKTSIQELFALIQRANLLISIDTAAPHIAEALKTPAITLFGAGDPKIWGHNSPTSKIIYKNNVCTSCMKSKCKNKNYLICMKSIKIEDVLSNVDIFIK